MHFFRLGVPALVLVLSGCAIAPRRGEPDGFQQSIAELRQKHGTERVLVGTIPWDYENSFDPTVLKATGVPVPDWNDIEQPKHLSFMGMKNGEMCFLLVEELETNDYQVLGNGDEPKFVAKRRARIERSPLYLEAFDSLTDVPTRPVLPPAGAPRLTVRTADLGVNVKEFTKRVRDYEGNVRTKRSKYREQTMVYEVCGPPPVVTENTRYFAVSQQFLELTLGESYTHTLYLFARQDALEIASLDLKGPGASTSTGGTRPPSDTANPPADAAPTASPSKGPPAAKMGGKPRSSQFMSIEGSIFFIGTTLTVTFPKPMQAAAGEKYWVTVVAASADKNAYTSYKYLDAEATRVEVAVPATTGDYEVRLHGNYPTKTYNLIDKLRFRSTQDVSKETEPESVSMPPPEVDKGAKSKLMSAAKVKLDPSAVFTVKFPKPLKAKGSERYWIAVSKVTASPDGYESYSYVDGSPESIDLTAPAAVGEYEVRLHGNYPTKKTNIVDRFKITVR